MDAVIKLKHKQKTEASQVVTGDKDVDPIYQDDYTNFVSLQKKLDNLFDSDI